MNADRLQATRRKNRAFLALYEGVLCCERRRHRDGLVPGPWSARLADLERMYRAAVEVLVKVVTIWDL